MGGPITNQLFDILGTKIKWSPKSGSRWSEWSHKRGTTVICQSLNWSHNNVLVVKYCKCAINYTKCFPCSERSGIKMLCPCKYLTHVLTLFCSCYGSVTLATTLSPLSSKSLGRYPSPLNLSGHISSTSSSSYGFITPTATMSNTGWHSCNT